MLLHVWARLVKVAQGFPDAVLLAVRFQIRREPLHMLFQWLSNLLNLTVLIKFLC